VSLSTSGSLACTSEDASDPASPTNVRLLSSQRLARFVIRQTREHVKCGISLSEAQFDEQLTDYVTARAIAEYRSCNISVATRALMIELYAGLMRAAARDRQRREERAAPALRLIA
jgi:hypothetical protein